MAVKGNYRQKNERLTFADYNKAWASKRRNAIKQGQQLRDTMTANFFDANNRINQMRPTADNRGVYSSTVTVMSRINILV